MRIVALACLVLAVACKKPEPDWAKLVQGRAGESTIGGQPVTVPRFATPPVLDGKLDDAVWAGAALLGPLVDPFTGQGGDHAVAALARMGWDDRALYLGVVIRDRVPTSPFRSDEIDPHVWGQSSGIELMLQPGDPGDNRDYYELQVDVNGAVFDSHFEDYNAPITGERAQRVFGHQDWQSHVERAISVDKGRFWSVEVALPWSSIQGARVDVPPKPGNVWRLNLYSFRDGQRLARAWSPLRGQGNFHKSSRFGRVQFQ